MQITASDEEGEGVVDDEDHAGDGDGGKVEQVNCTLVEAEDRCEKKTKRSSLFG